MCVRSYIKNVLRRRKARKEIPTLKMLTYTMDELEEKANNLYEKIKHLDKYANITIEDGLSQVGGGSMPLETIDSKAISITPKKYKMFQH
ncbi:hypothetical protein Q5M85_08285 [Paraclostridium bifermentans]|nr:hypothetical protein [Paraclostridium bifermentans]